MGNIETVAIRFNPIDSQLGDALSDLKGLSPVIAFGRQGQMSVGNDDQTLYGEPLAINAGQSYSAGKNPEKSARGGVALPHEINDFVFVVDASSSMGLPIHPGVNEKSKLSYLARRFRELPTEYLGRRDARVSLITFNDSHTVVVDKQTGRDWQAMRLREQSGIFLYTNEARQTLIK